MKRNDWKKIISLSFFFYLLALIQGSFLIHFSFQGFFPNIILISTLLLSFLENSQNNISKIRGFLAGFFLDLSSSLPLGTATFNLGILNLIIKKILQNFQKNSSLLFFLLFIFATFSYELLINFSLFFLRTSPKSFISFFKNFFSPLLLIQISYNLLFGILIFLLFKLFILKFRK